MTANYIAAFGSIDAGTAARMRHLDGYSIVLDRPGALVATTDDAELIDLGCGRGLVLGTIFDRAGRAPLTKFDEPVIDAALDDRGAGFCTRYWGSYVAIFVKPDGHASVLRDPSGAMACYVVRCGASCILTSNVRVAAMNTVMPSTVDFAAVAVHLLWPERRSRRTCLAGIEELFPGESLSVSREAITMNAVWTPWTFTARAEQFETRAEAIELVRRTTLNTVSAWCRRYPKPLVSLSGGLDSSIVLASARTPAGAVTFTTGEGLGDERAFARAAADHYSVSLLDYPLLIDAIDPRCSAAATLPRPVAALFGQELDRRWREAALATAADALFHGGGGDNVFCYLYSSAPYLDSLLMRGPGRASTATLDCLSALTRASRWRIRKAAMHKVFVDRGRYRWFRDARLLAYRAIQAGTTSGDHPWFATVPRWTLPGKLGHVGAIVRVQNHLEAVEPRRVVPVVAPLMSQPMIETCLRVPTWMWCADGNNRAVAREAFRDLLPAKIIDRRGKGSPAAFEARIVATRRDELRAMLLDGILAREQLIDRKAIAEALASDGPLRGELYQRVTELVDVEAWMQSWAGLERLQN